MSKGTRKKYKIQGGFFPFTNKIAQSEAFKRLNPIDVFVLTKYWGKYIPDNKDNLCVTNSEIKNKASSATFSKSKLWARAFGFLYVVQFGRLERNPTILGVCGKWEHLSNHPDKLDRIERLLRRHEKVKRIPIRILKHNMKSNPDKTPSMRRKMLLRKIEHKIFKV